MSGNNLLLNPDSYSGENIGAAGYGVTAIGTNPHTLPSGGVIANPSAYTAGCSSLQSGGKKRRRNRKSMKKRKSCIRWGGKLSTRKSVAKRSRGGSSKYR
jgi:hypothetical protein